MKAPMTSVRGPIRDWIERHPEGLDNAGSMPLWPERFAARETALTCFPRNTLESALA